MGHIETEVKQIASDTYDAICKVLGQHFSDSNIRVEIIIHNAPNDKVEQIQGEQMYKAKAGSELTIYSMDYTPFEIKPKEIDNSCSDCGEFISHHPNCPHF